MTRFVLDCTAAALPEWWRPDWPRVIDIEPGSFEADWDIVDAAFLAAAESGIEERWQREGKFPNRDLPIGFDTCKIPVGACIRRLE